MPGHNVSVVEPRNDLLCPHCDHLLRDAVQTELQGDRLCKTCFQEIAKMQSPRCPCCRMDASVDYFVDGYVRAEVGKLIVRCSKFSRGCEWQGPLTSLEEHLKKCGDLQELCPNKGCGVLVPVDKLAQHAENCSYQQVTCQFCGAKLQLCNLGDHFKECKRFLVTCQRCGSRLAQEDLSVHRINCSGPPSPNELVLPTWQLHPEQETPKTQKHKDLPSWNSEAYQELVRVSFAEELQNELARMRARLSELEFENSALKDKNSRLEAENSTVKAHKIEAETHSYEMKELLQTSDSDGTITWPMIEFLRRKTALMETNIPYIDSPPFYTGKSGYKLCLRVYLDGDCISVSIMLLEGKYDSFLAWPFKAKVCLQILSKSCSISPISEESFPVEFQQSPTCHVCSRFVKLSVLVDESTHYVKDDAMNLKCTVETS